MKKNAIRHRVYVKLTAVWGNDDADSTIMVSRRRCQAIRAGAEYVTSARSWYEGGSYPVAWLFTDGKVSVYGGGGMECVIDQPVGELIEQIVTTR